MAYAMGFVLAPICGDLLGTFREEWAHYFRGNLPVKRDVDVTAKDLTDKNLILFGDPGSNSLILRALKRLPVKWTTKAFLLAGGKYDSATSTPSLIAPSPFGNRDHYVVINSGHSFHEAELNRLNYLLFPRNGDWSVISVSGSASATDPARVTKSGYFDEDWR